MITRSMALSRSDCSFFFSSRRRHTRSLRDWSSDVCSSDLASSMGERTPPPLLVLAGTNGAGKSSIGGRFYRESGGEYFNPDEFARRILATNPEIGRASCRERVKVAHAWHLVIL